MRRLLRWFFYLIGILVVLMIISYSAAQFYKPKILEAINRELNDGINGDFQIGQLDFSVIEQFPDFSITLRDIYLRGPEYAVYHQDFFSAEKIYVRVKPAHLFKGIVDLESIIIKNGNIFIFRTATGYTNMDVFKKKSESDTVKAKGSRMSLDLKNILFEDTRFTYVDTLKNKSYDIKFIKTTADIVRSDSSQKIVLDGEMFFGGLTFNTKKGGYLVNTPTTARLDMEFLPGQQKLDLKPSVLQFTKSTVRIAGYFDFTSPGVFSLQIDSDSIDYGEGLTLVTRALNEKLSAYQFDKRLALSVKLLGNLTPSAEPEIDISFASAKNRFTHGKMEVKNLDFAGTFCNHVNPKRPNDDVNSMIDIKRISGTLSDFPVSGKLSIANLTDPHLILSTESKVKLTSMNHYTDTTRLKFLSGTATANVSYDGLLNEYLDSTNTGYKGKLRGTMSIANGAAKLGMLQKKFEKVQAQVHFTEKQVTMDKVSFIINGNPVKIKGSILGFVPFFYEPATKGIIKLSVESSRMDLATLIKTKTADEPVTTAKQDRKKISNLMETLNEKVAFEVDLKIDELLNGAFHASNLIGKVSLHQGKFIANPITMDLAKGTVSVAITMSDLDKKISPVTLKAEVKGAEINDFFLSFGNFSQTTIKSNNLSGKIFTEIELKAQVDDQFNVLMPSLSGEVDFKIRKGRLMDFEPLQRMSNFLFKKRDFTDVQFAEIRSRFQLSGQSLNISRMEIESSVLTLFVEGRYSLANDTDLSIQVPLSNLKKRDKDYQPENVGVDAKIGPSVFLRVHKNKEGETVIAYNIFKKFKKKDNKVDN